MSKEEMFNHLNMSISTMDAQEVNEVALDVHETDGLVHQNSNYIKEERMSDDYTKEDKIDICKIITHDEYLKNEVQEMGYCELDNKIEIEKNIQNKQDEECQKILIEEPVLILENVKEEPETMTICNDDLEDDKFTSHSSYCEECSVNYEGYCPKCFMLSRILHNSVLNISDDKAKKSIPKNILEIRSTSHGVGIFSLKTIPIGVIFGPFHGVAPAQTARGSVWEIKDGNFNAKNVNWMQFISCNENSSLCNLVIFQHESNLYYQSDQKINENEQLFVYLDKECVKNLENDQKTYYRPVVEKSLRNSYGCTFCCLGFSSEQYLIGHKGKCLHSPENFDIQEITQCFLCKVYFSRSEYLEHHTSYCHDVQTRSLSIMEWTKDATVQLIDLYREKEVLWNTTSRDFKNRQLKHDALRHIASVLKLEKVEVEKKIRSLTGQFQREQKKSKSGATNDEVHESKWFAFQSLMFLKGKNKPRDTLDGVAKETPVIAIDKDEMSVDRDDCNKNDKVDDKKNDNNLNVPKLNKNLKRKNEDMVAEAYNVMKSLKNKYVERDEYSIYGEYVACKLRKLSTTVSLNAAQHHINQILYMAQMGYYDKPTPIYPPQAHLAYPLQPYSIQMQHPLHSSLSTNNTSASSSSSNQIVGSENRAMPIEEPIESEDEIEALLSDR